MTTPTHDTSSELSGAVRASWHRFLAVYEPLRPELYRYCRSLTRSPWDAEDLSQDTMARAFVTLGCMENPPPNPRAWLFRVASNLWIDQMRHAALLLTTATIEVVGVTTQFGSERARDTVLQGMLFGSARMATSDVHGGMNPRYREGVLPTPARFEVRAHRGEWLLLSWYAHQEGEAVREAVRAITRVEIDGDRVSRVQNSFFTPEFIADVCRELGVPFHVNGYWGC